MVTVPPYLELETMPLVEFNILFYSILPLRYTIHHPLLGLP